MMETPTLVSAVQHSLYLLRIAMCHPPWTFVNLFVYAAAPNATIRRGSYASMWATLLCFNYALLLDRTWHRRMMEKQRFSRLTFYTLDALVHWVPLVVLHVPYRGWMANATGLLNFVWGVLVTGGTMDLSEAYVPLTRAQWRKMWMLSFVVTVAIPI